MPDLYTFVFYRSAPVFEKVGFPSSNESRCIYGGAISVESHRKRTPKPEKLDFFDTKPSYSLIYSIGWSPVRRPFPSAGHPIAIRPIPRAGCAMVVSLMLAATSDPSCPATDMSSSPRIVLYGSRSRTRIIRSARSRSVSTSTCRTTAAFCLCTSTRNGGCVRYGSGRSLTFPNGPSFCCGAPPIRGTRCWQCARVISVPIWEASDGRLRLRASTNAMGFTRLDGMLGVAAVSDDPYRAIHECVRAAVTRTHIRMRS